MEAIQNEQSKTWHLVGQRGCGAEPDENTVEGNGSVIRNQVDRDDGEQYSHCNLPSDF